ncbi:MAG: SNF2-related protein [Bacteroidota bacterium]
MKMGTGKTKTAFDLAKSRKGYFDIILWIAPASLINDESYIAEINKWRGDISVVYFTIEGVSQSDNKYLEMRSISQENRVFCIVDESITIKNTDAGRTKRLLDCRDLFDFRLILNGTPISKGLIDLYSQIEFISPKILNMTETQFAHSFLQFKKDGHKPWKRWSKPENEQALIEIIRPYIFDADLDIPVKLNRHDILLRLSNAEKSEYEDFKKEFLSKQILDFLAVTQKFQSIYTCSKSKIEWLCSLPNKKHIIFVKFLHEIDAVKNHYTDSFEYSGRQKCRIDDFKNSRARFLIMTYGTGSMGLNLQFCNNIVFFSQTFDWKDKEHGLHRCYRNGQSRDVNVYDLWLDTGLENLFRKSLEKKTDTAKNIQDFIDKNGAMAL